jgi:tRNA-specific 2-thiouridylase
MSGGVDSAVAAARAVEAGHEVVGVHLALSRMPGTLRTGARGCCTIEDSMDAQRAANIIGIPYYVWDFSERFKLDVVEDFIDEYAAGRTPNPCMRCNERIKFSALLEKALALGFDAVATGHYADVRRDADGNAELHRAATWAKDQSYVLGVLTADQLEHSLFPDICFIPDGNTRGWLAEKVGAEQGEILDRSGTVLGKHEGALAFTIGQRKGLNIGYPSDDGMPRFVLEVVPKTNTVIVGPKEALDLSELAGSTFTWAGLGPVESGFSTLGDDGRIAPFECEVQIRAHADPVPAVVSVAPGSDGALELVIRPVNPINGVSPGQTAVVYVGTRVLGQCTIARTVSALAIEAVPVPA